MDGFGNQLSSNPSGTDWSETYIPVWGNSWISFNRLDYACFTSNRNVVGDCRGHLQTCQFQYNRRLAPSVCEKSQLQIRKVEFQLPDSKNSIQSAARATADVHLLAALWLYEQFFHQLDCDNRNPFRMHYHSVQAFQLHVFHTVIWCKEYRMSPN
jgi:hypothetical protein